MKGGMPLRDYLAWLRASTTGSERQVPTEWGTLATEPESPGETGQGSSPETSDQSLDGRMALAAQMNDPTSTANLTLSVMGALAGPFGSIGAKGAKMAITAHNQSVINATLAAQSLRFSEAQEGQLAQGNVPGNIAQGTVPVGIPENDPTIDAPGVAAAAAAEGVSTPGDTPTGPSANYRAGGVVRDLRAGLAEPITAHEGEFVVQREPAVKYRRLLDAINDGKPAGVKRALRAALDA